MKSIREKAQRYDEALERAKMEKEKSRNLGLLEFIDENFPELKESEDERIRNEIIAFVEQSIHRGGGTPIPEEQEAKWLSWLEKQSKDSPVLSNSSNTGKSFWSEEDEDYYDVIIAKLEVTQDDTLLTDNQIEFLKSLKDRVQPQSQWKPSDEQFHWLKWAINRMPDTEKANEAEAVLEELLEDLKKLNVK